MERDGHPAHLSWFMVSFQNWDEWNSSSYCMKNVGGVGNHHASIRPSLCQACLFGRGQYLHHVIFFRIMGCKLVTANEAGPAPRPPENKAGNVGWNAQLRRVPPSRSLCFRWKVSEGMEGRWISLWMMANLRNLHQSMLHMRIWAQKLVKDNTFLLHVTPYMLQIPLEMVWKCTRLTHENRAHLLRAQGKTRNSLPYFLTWWNF